MIVTSRLMLRQWQEKDAEPFFRLNADPEVMEYFPATQTREQSDAFIRRVTRDIEKRGWGFWAVERKDTGDFIGFVGLNRPSAKLPFNPCTEIGWRLAKEHWGVGFATEAAAASLEFAFTTLAEAEIVSFTAVQNTRSQAVMRKLGMTNSGENFLHPSLPAGHTLQEHVLFKITREAWLAKKS